MLFGHSCKVKSKQAIHIDKNTYENYQKVTSCEDFLRAIQIAKEQLHASPYTMHPVQCSSPFQLPLRRNIFGLYVLPVYVNHTLLHFIIDTGAQISGIRENVAKQLQVAKTTGTISVGSIGGTQKELAGVCVDSFQLGGAVYEDVGMVLLGEDDFSLRIGKVDMFSFDGLLGWDILCGLDFEIDDIEKQFKVIKNQLCIPYPNMLQGGFPCFIVQHGDGKSGLFGFDSGSKVSWLGEQTMLEHRYTVSNEIKRHGFGVHGLETMHMRVVDACTLYLDKAEIKLYNTMSGRTNLFSSFAFDGVFGNEICAGRRIRLINSKGMVLIA